MPMNLLPYQDVSFRSGLNAAEVSKKLRGYIKPETATNSGYWGTRNTKEYEGEVGENKFKIQKIIQSLYSVIPVISGTFIQESGGTKINMKMRLSTIPLIAVCAFGGLAIVLFIAISISTYFWAHLNFGFLIPLGFMTFLYLMVTIAFNLECRKSVRDFKILLEDLQ